MLKLEAQVQSVLEATKPPLKPAEDGILPRCLKEGWMLEPESDRPSQKLVEASQPDPGPRAAWAFGRRRRCSDPSFSKVGTASLHELGNSGCGSLGDAGGGGSH